MLQMVGPLSSEEIEDVVSSVRRLVSNEQRPRTPSRDANVDRLILTPSLRVVSEVSPLAPLVLQSTLDDASVEPTPDGGVVPEAEVLLPTDEAMKATLGGAAEDMIETVWEDEIWVETEDASLAEIALGAEEAEVLTPPQEAAAAAFAPDPDEMPEPWAQGETEWVEDDPIPFVPLRRRAENLAARLAAGVAMDAARTDSAPDGAVAAEPADFVEPEAGDEAAAFDAELEFKTTSEPTHQRMPTEILDADGVPLAVLDEAALQEIVRLMIREELKGTLGERITRSVRKLVRVEINRALVARDLD
jgi:hypothetical protein